MSILTRLSADLKDAMKAHDKMRVNTLRLLISQIKKEKIDSVEDLTTEQETGILLTAAKRRKEAIQAFESGNRQDLVEIESQELEIISEYLPEQMSDGEIEKLIEEVIKAAGASSMKDLGRIMAEVMKRLKGKADGKKVQTIVRSKLS